MEPILKKNYDVVILGGGASGSLFALNLIKREPSLSILILDKNEIFSSKVGEATSEVSSIFLNRLGISPILKKQSRKTGLRFVFNEKDKSNKSNIIEFSSPSFKSIANGYHLNRAIFDNDLLKECQQLGVTVLRPIFLSQIHFEKNKCKLDFTYREDKVTIESKWFIDASGRSRFIKNRLGWEDEKIDLNTGAIAAHFTNLGSQTNWDSEESSYWRKNAIGNKSYSTTHFLKANSWWWLIKVDETTTSIGVVYDKNNVQFNDAEEYYDSTLLEDDLLSKITLGAKRSKINHLSSLPYISSKLHQDNIAVIGDAGAFIDPLFSPGLDLICQQNDHLVGLLTKYFKTGVKNQRLWNKYERIFIKAYHDRTYVYSKIYNYMESYDLFSNVTQLLFFAYQTFTVLPLKYLPNRMKKPLRLYMIDKLVIKILFKRYDQILKKRKKQERKSSSLTQPISYSTVKIPKGLFYFLKPVQLLLLWFFNYIRIEASEIRFFLSAKK